MGCHFTFLQYNPYLDTEAHDDDDDDDEQDKNSDVCLHFDVSDEEEHTLQDAEADGQNKLDSHARDNTNNIDLSTSEEDNGDESRKIYYTVCVLVCLSLINSFSPFPFSHYFFFFSDICIDWKYSRMRP